MGIKYLNNILKKYAKNGIEDIYYNTLFNKVIGAPIKVSPSSKRSISLFSIL